MSYRLMIRGMVCLPVFASLVFAERLPREQWGAPAVSVSHREDTWIVAGKRNRVTLRASDLTMSVQAGPVSWNKSSASP